ncbi:MAG: hypothetical protein J2P37_30225, partial [Ktedonobacteraceae bacterium]|nr:hypothetical protein [Ktedonobacteraceae bacterium]
RVHDRQDRRLVKIFLTTRGRELAHVLEPVALAFHERLFQGFSTEEQRAFLVFLQRLDSSLPGSSRDLLSSLLSNESKGDQL